MTLYEAIGVHRCDIDIKTGEKLEHSEIYGRAIDLLGGLDMVAQYIPFSMETIREALKTDPHLNNTLSGIGIWLRGSSAVCSGTHTEGSMNAGLQVVGRGICIGRTVSTV